MTFKIGDPVKLVNSGGWSFLHDPDAYVWETFRRNQVYIIEDIMIDLYKNTYVMLVGIPKWHTTGIFELAENEQFHDRLTKL